MKAFVGTVLLLCLAALANAQGPAAAWTDAGVFGGRMRSVAVSPSNPDVVLVGLNAAILVKDRPALYRSTDAGASWSAVPIPYAEEVRGLGILPSGVSIMATSGGVWRSLDLGASWSALPAFTGFSPERANVVRRDPKLAGRVWLGLDGSFTGGKNLWMSDDEGQTWSDRSVVVTPGNREWVSSLAIDPLNSSHIVALVLQVNAGFIRSVHVSWDAGQTWATKASGVGEWTGLAHDGSRIFSVGGMTPEIALDEAAHSTGLHVSSDDGVTWTELSDATWPSRALSDIEVDPSHPLRLTVGASRGVYRSSDGGVTWNFGAGGVDGLRVIDVAEAVPGAASYVTVGAFGVFKSVAGADFVASSAGILELPVLSVAHNPLDPSELAVAVHAGPAGGVLTSVDGGLTWAMASLEPVGWEDLEFDAAGRLCAVSESFPGNVDRGVYRRDAGGFWSRIGPNPAPGPAPYSVKYSALGIGRVASGLIVVAGSHGHQTGDINEVWLSNDDGATWTALAAPAPGDRATDVFVVSDGSDQNILIAYQPWGAGGLGRLLQTLDGGASGFLQAGVGLPTHRRYGRLAWVPSTGDLYLAIRLLFGGQPSVYQSSDVGATWSPTSIGGDFDAVWVDELRDQRVFAGGAPEYAPGVVISEDGLASAAAFAAGLQGAGATYDMDSIASAGCSTLLLAKDTGLYRSEQSSCNLETSADTLSASGGSISFGLAAGPLQAGQTAFLLGSSSGSAPGFTALGAFIPLNIDSYFLMTLTQPTAPIFRDFVSTLGVTGQSAGRLTLTAHPNLVGAVLTHAFVAFDFSGGAVGMVSNAVDFTFVP